MGWARHPLENTNGTETSDSVEILVATSFAWRLRVVVTCGPTFVSVGISGALKVLRDTAWCAE